VSEEPAPAPSVWDRALLAAALLAVDPAGLGGIHVVAHAGPVRDAWLARLRDMLPAGTPVRRIPAGIGDEGLLGGLDLAATLTARRPVGRRGLLAETDGGIAVLAMAERASPELAARLAAVLDTGHVAAARDGVSLVDAARIALVALDESADDNEAMPAALSERLALRVDLGTISVRATVRDGFEADAVAAARTRLAGVSVDDAALQAICAASLSLGIGSTRAELFALNAARASAALFDRASVEADDLTLACALVLAHRATRLPASEPPPDEQQPPEPPPPESEGDDSEPPPGEPDTERPLDDVVLDAVAAAIPADLLARLKVSQALRARGGAAGRAGARQKSGKRGRPAGTFRGAPGSRDARLNLVATLRAAAPWQPIRRAGGASTLRIHVRPDDFRVTRFEQRRETTTIFVVDASGSAALHRLAEAKGAVELLLADCYVRRDRVSVLAFRGRGAEIVLPPTRSLVRAKRSLAGLPGGGGTPLAAGIDAGFALADAVRRQGGTPTLVFLTDGRANVSRDGIGGRDRAEADALDAAGRLRAGSFASLLVDIAPRPSEVARKIGAAMGAVYLPLPQGDARALDRVVRAALS
jgi:magnesium chelatase subunit D